MCSFVFTCLENSFSPLFHSRYLTIPPCVFGSADEGLPPPPGGEDGLPFGTRLFSRKVCRADFAHHGEMSLWQTYGVFY